MEAALTGYKKVIYDTYVTGFKSSPLMFNASQARRWGESYRSFLNGWLPQSKDACILDIGCGDGRLLYFLKEMGYYRLAGVDISPEQVIISKQVIDNIEEADAIEFLDRHREEYDFISAIDIVEHFGKEEVLRFLDAGYKALKPGGRLVLQVPNGESPWCSAILYGDFTHELAFQPRLMGRLLAKAGFAEIEPREGGPVVRNFTSLIRFLVWKCIKGMLIIWNLAEAGSRGSGIYTRVFFISGKKVLNLCK